jgi:Pyruvate/2-oxoacid:ferredoxin oxidoreductase delta subunit
MSKPPYEKQEKIEYHSEKDMPLTPISFGYTTINRTGSWRYMMPFYEDKTPPCNNGCPASVDIEGMMRLVEQGELKEAYRLLRKENPFAATCGMICPHPCETVCNRGEFDRALSIKAVERMVAESGLDKDIAPDKGSKKGGKVALVGAGPIGLSAGYFLAVLGYEVDLFEQEKEFGGALRSQIADDKLLKEILDKEIAFIKKTGVNLLSGKRFGDDISLEQLKEKYQAIFLALGKLPEEIKRKGVDEFGKTDEPGLFAFSLPRESNIATAVASGKKGAMAIDSFISQKSLSPEEFLIGEKGPLSFRKYRGEKIKRSNHVVSFSELNLAYFEKKDGKEPKGKGYTADEARKEASRCFHCGVCNMCGNCYIVCPDAAIQPLPGGKGYRLHYGYCKGCLLCINECPRAAMSSKEVGR